MSECKFENEDVPEQPMLVRQPIFDRDKNILGYEILCSSQSNGNGSSSAGSLADLISDSKEMMSVLGVELTADKKLFLNIDSESYLDAPTSLSETSDCVFGVCEGAAYSKQCSCFAHTMREQGGTMALDSDINPVLFKRLADDCDIVKVSLKDKSPMEIVGIRKKYKEFGGTLLATDIADWESFEGTRALGFKYFQGSFFALPNIEADAQLQASAIPKLQLIRELNNPACDMDDLADIIATDVSLSYRILMYINSASFGLQRQIKSIQQAVALLGLTELKHWATVVIMSDLDSTPKGEELAYMALQRARFLSKLAESIAGCEFSPETMFVLGLFSKLDALLSYPMEKALEGVALDEELKGALCGEENEYGQCLRMLEAVESGDWETANEILGLYGACVTQAATHYLKASSWAAQQLPNMKE